MCGAVSPLPLTLPWHSAETENSAFTFVFTIDKHKAVGGTMPPLNKIYVGCTVSLFTVGTSYLAVKAPLTLYPEMGHNSCALVV
jgi:hypothetical protein